MEFITEIDEQIKAGLEQFKEFVIEKLQEDANYLSYQFWVSDGAQMTVLNYLIHQHQERKKAAVVDALSTDLTGYIDFVLSRTEDKNIGEPLHQALAAGKIQLVFHLLDNNVFDLNRRDEEGRTLLSLALTTKNRSLLSTVLAKKPNINATTRLMPSGESYQPLHQAILLDFAAGVHFLANAGAELANPVGSMMETPIRLAARLAKIKSLEALLEFPIEKLNIEAQIKKIPGDNELCDTAMEALCKLLDQNSDNKDLLYGIAMLLCRGAEPPRSDAFCQLLADKRSDLLKAIDSYLDSRPDLVDPFVHRCHLTDSALHKIVYVDHSWGSSLRQLLGRPSAAAFVIERLVTRKYSRRSEDNPEVTVLPTAAAAPLTGKEPPLKLYAEFVRRYSEVYENQRITNPWSTMRWMISEGKCNWDSIKSYAKNHPGTRTQIIYDEMFKTLPSVQVHEQLDIAANKPLDV